jgi:dynein assembly factor 2
MATKLNSSFEPTRKELRKLKAALDNAEFRRHLVDYVSETTSAEAVAAYEADVAAIERQHGFEVTFLHPQPGFVLKTTNLRSDEKVFLNVCSDAAVAKAESSEADGGVHFAIPYSQSPAPRKDVDKSGRPCAVYDVIFHPETLAMADESTRMKAVITETALEAVEKAFAAVKLQRDNIKCPK